MKSGSRVWNFITFLVKIYHAHSPSGHVGVRRTSAGAALIARGVRGESGAAVALPLTRQYWRAKPICENERFADSGQ